MKVRFRIADNQDLEYMRKLRNANRFCFINQEKISKAEQEAWYVSAYRRYFIILVDEKNAGIFSIASGIEEGTYEIGNLIIAEKYRGQGVLPAVFAQVKKFYKSDKFRLRVLASNERAINAYKQLGFTPVGTLDMTTYE